MYRLFKNFNIGIDDKPISADENHIMLIVTCIILNALLILEDIKKYLII